MIKRSLITLAVLAAFAGPVFAAGTDIGHNHSEDDKVEHGSGDSSKKSLSVGHISLVNQALMAAVPLPGDYIVDAWRQGKSRKSMTEYRTGDDLLDYAATRIAELSRGIEVEEQRLAARYKACGWDEACIWRLAYRETDAFAFQSLSEPQQPLFAAYDLAGFNKEQGNRIVDKEWPTYWAQAAIHAYAARAVAKELLKVVPKGKKMSLAARRVALFDAFFDLPEATFDNAFKKPGQLTMTTFGYRANQPLEFTVRYDGKETSVFKVDAQSGLTVLAGGGPYFGMSEYVDGIKVAYTDEASSDSRTSHSSSTGDTTSKRGTLVTPEAKKQGSN